MNKAALVQTPHHIHIHVACARRGSCVPWQEETEVLRRKQETVLAATSPRTLTS